MTEPEGFLNESNIYLSHKWSSPLTRIYGQPACEYYPLFIEVIHNLITFPGSSVS